MRLVCATVFSAAVLLPIGQAERPIRLVRPRSDAPRLPSGGDESVRRFTLNALDHTLCIFDFETESPGSSRQIDEVVREYAGNLLFTANRSGTRSGGGDFARDLFVVLENDRYSGTFLDLAEEAKPDTEFSLFYGLRLYKRRLQLRQFPYADRYLPYEGLDSTRFFSDNRDPLTTVEVRLSHVYILRLFHRTRVADDRTVLLRVIDHVPGVSVTVLWRDLPNRSEP